MKFFAELCISLFNPLNEFQVVISRYKALECQAQEKKKRADSIARN
jgi:hypothetical protein